MPKTKAMTPERWEQIEAVLQDALDRPPLERAAYLEKICASDEELRVEASSLIDAYVEAGDFIEQPAIARDADVFLGAESDSNTGREIGPYKVIERLGAGGMGEVYLAQDTRLGRMVALKLLPPYFAADVARLRRFQSEARAASALNHPNILTVYEIGEHESVYFIATEFIEGQTIRALMQDGKLSLEKLFNCVEQIASALSAAHAAGIVHRDIKPENIMLRPDGLLKILDFGIAKLIEPTVTDNDAPSMITETGLVLGTVNYMSPEQARGLAVDERTDIWSLGVVLYEMLAGVLPLSGATRMDTLVAILEREPASLPQVHLQSVVRRCLAKDLEKRYRAVSEFLVDFKEAKATRDRKQPAPARALVVVITVLLLGVTGGVVLYRRYHAPTVISQSATQPAKLYSQMNERERLEFISTQEHRISNMMSDRAMKLNDDAVRVIKAYVDRYVANLNDANGSGLAYERAQPFVPVIARSFAARKVPIIIGIYLPVIESGYRECYVSSGGARGLFQFMPETAERYGVARGEMCDVEKMSPAAAHFVADRMAELGEDSDSVTLVLLSYNRGAEWVRETLRQLRGTDKYERNFWTLLVNRESLDEIFHDKNAGYVPSFFAAAIIGENPGAFGLQTSALSTLAKDKISSTAVNRTND